MKLFTLNLAFLLSLSFSQYALAAPEYDPNLPKKPPVNNGGVASSHQQTLLQQAKQIQTALATGNFSTITPYIHPSKGVRFSMYAYITPQDKVFSRQDFRHYLQKSKIRFTWGEQDGTGDSYIVPLPHYLKNWVKAGDFSQASMAVNTFQKGGNSLNNLTVFYPKQDFVEFYTKGSVNYDFMDWRVMRLVFENYHGTPYLVGVVTDRWTI